MRNRSTGSCPRRVAISLDLDWGYKRHLEVYAGCQRYADKAGWECSITPVTERMLMPQAGGCPFDGVIARATEPLAQAAQRAAVPVVNVWLNSPARSLPSVFPDFQAAGAMAAEHLLARGFRQFGYLGFLRDWGFELQFKGFRATIRQAGFRCSSHRFSHLAASGSAPDWEAFIAGLEAWMDTWKPPIGIFVTQDIYCRYLINVCRLRGLRISHDVGIIGCHNEATICDTPSPGITSIDLGYAQVGYRAGALLDRLMDGQPSPTAPELVPPASLVARQTTHSFAVDDPLVACALRFIAENCERRIRVKHVVASVGTTRRTLERRVREAVGQGIAEEIVRLRLERAKRRLVESNVSLKTLARELGFRNADHFSKVFARVEGTPVGVYRKKRQPVFLRQNQA